MKEIIGLLVLSILAILGAQAIGKILEQPMSDAELIEEFGDLAKTQRTN